MISCTETCFSRSIPNHRTTSHTDAPATWLTSLHSPFRGYGHALKRGSESGLGTHTEDAHSIRYTDPRPQNLWLDAHVLLGGALHLLGPFRPHSLRHLGLTHACPDVVQGFFSKTLLVHLRPPSCIHTCFDWRIPFSRLLSVYPENSDSSVVQEIIRRIHRFDC